MKLGMVLKYALFSIIAFLFVFPLYYLISCSFSSEPYIYEGHLFPQGYLGYWWEVLTGFRGVGGMGIVNSIVISASSVLLSLVLGFPAAYAISRYKFMADKHIFFWFLTNRMTPPACLVLPYLIMWRAFGIWDTLQGVVLAYCVFNVPLGVWIMTSFMASIPKEIDEAAFIDGYSLARYFRRIFLPLCKPGIAVTSFFIWMYSWSEMFMASVITSVVSKPLNPQLLGVLGTPPVTTYGLAAAGGALTTIPGLLLVYWARTYLAKGFTYGRI